MGSAKVSMETHESWVQGGSSGLEVAVEIDGEVGILDVGVCLLDFGGFDS